MNKHAQITEPTNGGARQIEYALPYHVTVTIEGASDLLWHRWNADSVDAKAVAAKGSRAKKTDDIESYVWRNEKGELCLPGHYLVGSIVNAAKFRQDPRSPRKSAQDLFKAAVVSLTPLASLGKTTWDYEDRRRVNIQRNGINRVRPATKAGWRATIQLQVNVPEYVDRNFLREVVELAGRLIGVADHRPTYGRFGIVKFE